MAITPSARSLARLGKLVVAYRARSSADSVRWIPSLNWHVTLSFLGNIDGTRVESVARAVDQARDGRGALSLRPRYLGGFPRRKPRVMACALDPTPRLERLVERIRTALDEGGFEADDKPFRPHVTVGRLTKARAPVLASDVSHARILFDKVSVFRSETLSSGARYEALHEFPLVREES